jgi:hypothetical protein
VGTCRDIDDEEACGMSALEEGPDGTAETGYGATTDDEGS